MMSPKADNSIINAFKQEAKENGIEHSTLTKVAEREGCSRQTVYEVIGSKPMFIKWITLNDNRDILYGLECSSIWKCETYHLLHNIKMNDWFYKDVYSSKYYFALYKILQEHVSKDIIPDMFTSSKRESESEQAREIGNFLSLALTGRIFQWIEDDFQEKPLTLMNNFAKLGCSALYCVE